MILIFVNCELDSNFGRGGAELYAHPRVVVRNSSLFGVLCNYVRSACLPPSESAVLVVYPVETELTQQLYFHSKSI